MADIHLNTISGNDANSGTLANPVQTVPRAISLFNTGDRILTWHNSVISINHFATKHGLYFDVYGGSNKPKWTGAIELTGWTNIGGGLWQVTNVSLPANIKKMLLSGSDVEKGSYPRNSQLSMTTAGAGTLSNTSLSAFTSLVGAEVAIRTQAYVIDVAPISSHTGDTITYSGSVTYTPQAGWGFFIQNHIDLLVDLGDWMYDSSTKTVTMYFGSESPSSYTIEATALPRLFQTNSGVNDTQIHNFIFTGCNDTPVLAQGGSGYLLENCEFIYNGRDGFQGENLTGIEIYNSLFQHNNNGGVRLKQNTHNSRIEDCEFYDIGLLRGAFTNGTGQGFGAATAGNSTHLLRNKADRIGYSGLGFEGSNSKCNFNQVSGFGLLLSDGGGIYSRNAGQNVNTGTECLNNKVSDSGDASQGTPYTDLQHGIYMDDYTRGVTIQNNLVSSVKGRGFYLHNNTDVKINDNISINNVWALYSQKDSSFLSRDIVVTGNAFIATNTSQKLVGLHNNSSDLNQFVASVSDFDNNTYYHPTPEAGNLFRTQSGGGTTDRSFSSFKSLYGWDANSTMNEGGYPSEFGFREEYNETGSAVEIDLSDGQYEDLAGTPVSIPYTLPAYEGAVLLKVSDTPPVQEYDISVTVIGSGSVSGGGTYEDAQEVTLSATSDAGWSFLHWSDIEGIYLDNPLSFIAEGNRSLEAIFVEDIPPVEEYTVTLIAGTGGTVSGSGVYEDGEQATVTAIPDSGWHFVRWSNDVTDNPYEFTVTGDVTLQAIFKQDDPSPSVIIVKGKFRIV